MAALKIHSLISVLLLFATILCCAHAFAEDFDGEGLSDNEAISSLAHKHMPAALGQRQGDRSSWLRTQGSGGGNKGRSGLARSVAEANFYSIERSKATSSAADYVRLAADSKRWLSLGVLKI